MSRFALLLAFVLCTAAPLGAQEPDLPAGVSEALAGRVRDAVAARWDVPAEEIALDFAALRSGRSPAGAGSLVLLGSGKGGYWVLRAEAEDGGSPVSLRVRAGVRTSESVASRRITRGEELTAADILPVEGIRWSEPQDARPAVEEGWVAQRLIREGEVLSQPAVQPPVAVHSGDAVELVWKRGGVGIRALGRAAGTGPVGRRIYVRTLSGKRLAGIVVAQGLVNVTEGGSDR